MLFSEAPSSGSEFFENHNGDYLFSEYLAFITSTKAIHCVDLNLADFTFFFGDTLNTEQGCFIENQL